MFFVSAALLKVRLEWKYTLVEPFWANRQRLKKLEYPRRIVNCPSFDIYWRKLQNGTTRNIHASSAISSDYAVIQINQYLVVSVIFPHAVKTFPLNEKNFIEVIGTQVRKLQNRKLVTGETNHDTDWKCPFHNVKMHTDLQQIFKFLWSQNPFPFKILPHLNLYPQKHNFILSGLYPPS